MMKRLIFSTTAPTATIIIRLMTGLIFLSEGVQKFMFPQQLGVGRFIKIGIPAPELMASFVGVVEIIGGVLLIIGLLTLSRSGSTSA